MFSKRRERTILTTLLFSAAFGTSALLGARQLAIAQAAPPAPPLGSPSSPQNSDASSGERHSQAQGSCCSIDLLLFKNKGRDATYYSVNGPDGRTSPKETRALTHNKSDVVTGDFGSCVMISELRSNGHNETSGAVGLIEASSVCCDGSPGGVAEHTNYQLSFKAHPIECKAPPMAVISTPAPESPPPPEPTPIGTPEPAATAAPEVSTAEPPPPAPEPTAEAAPVVSSVPAPPHHKRDVAKRVPKPRVIASSHPPRPRSRRRPYPTPYYPPTYSYPGYTAPTYTAPTYTAPAYNPPVYSPPVYNPPVYSPPAYAPAPSYHPCG